MSRVYEMTAGAVIDAEGRTIINGPVTIYNAEAGGSVIAPGTIKQGDGTAWPIEGVKTDGNGKVKLLWPDSAGAEPAKLWVDTSRGRWPLEPADLSSRVTELETSGVGVSDADVIDVVQGASSLALPAGTTIGGATPGTFTMDKTAGTVAFATGVTDEYLVFSGGVLTTDGGGGDGPWATKLVGRWEAPQSDLTLEPAAGAANLVGQADGGGAYRQENHAGLTIGGVTGALWRGTLRSFNATLGTSVPLDATLGYTTVTLVLRYVSFDSGGVTDCNLAQIGADSAGLLMLATRNGGSGLDIRVLGNAAHVGAVSAPELSTYVVPGDGSATSMASFLASGWHILTLALKQGAAGKVVLDGTTIATGVDSAGFGPTTTFKVNALAGGAYQAGFGFKFAAVGTGLTDADITTMHADLAS